MAKNFHSGIVWLLFHWRWQRSDSWLPGWDCTLGRVGREP